MDSIRGLENIEINFEGLSPEEVWSEYSGATYSLHPTVVNEGLPYSLLEAMGAGCIPIASMSGGMKSVIEDSQNGYLYDLSGSTNGFTETLKRAFMTDSKVRDAISYQAIDTVKKQYSAERHIKSISKLMLE